jgi:hypothetical protein
MGDRHLGTLTRQERGHFQLMSANGPKQTWALTFGLELKRFRQTKGFRILALCMT